MHARADHSSAHGKSSRASAPLQEDHIRVRAYYLWLDRGCQHGEDGQDWFAAQQLQLTATTLAASEAPPHGSDAQPHFTIRQTLAEHLSDPTHRFHPPGATHDRRVDVIAGEAPQRVRGRQSGGSLRPQQKKSQ